MLKSLLFLGLIVLASVASAQSGNENLPGGVLFDGEPSLAVNPRDQDNIVVAWMSEVLTDLQIGIRTSRSTDGGQTWSRSTVLPHFGTKWHSADVSIVFAKNGTAYLSYIDYHETPDSGGIYVTHSTDGGATWSLPDQAFSVGEVPGKSAIDRPWLAIDNSGSATDGWLYITTKPAPWIVPSKSSPNEPYFKRSTDHGKTWTSIAALDAEPYPSGYLIAAPMATPGVTASGAFVAAYPSYELLQPARHILARSYDGGQTFERYVVAEKRSASVQNDTLSKLGYSLVTDPHDSNRLALILPSDSLGDWDAFAIGSNDGGRTWGYPVRMNDDAASNGVVQDLVWGAYAQNGDLVAAWRDRRNASGTGYRQGADVYVAVSKDNGRTFGKNVRLSSTTADYASVLDGNGNDFLSCAVSGDSICVAWGDTRTGKLKIYFAKAAISDGIASVTQISDDATDLVVKPTVVSWSFTCELPFAASADLRLELVGQSGLTIRVDHVVVSGSTIRAELPAVIPSGAYLLSVSSGQGQARAKVIVAR